MQKLRALGEWLDERTGLGGVYNVLLRHPVPAALTTRAGWFYVFGFALVVVFVLQVLTGIGLATVYIPAPESAHESIRFITESATMGNLVRGMHYIGASVMVVLILFHTGRVFLMGSHKFPREFGWITGVILIGLTFIMVFTGQLLRWDVNSIASVNVAIEQTGRIPIIGEALTRFILAGSTIGGATLTRFYVLHVFIVPILIGLVIAAHIYLVIRNGVSEPPVKGEPVDPKTYRKRYDALLARGKPYFPDMVWREGVFAALVVLIIVALALVIGAPELGEAPDPTLTDVEPRPDWYLLWLFALYSIIGSRILEDFIIVLGPFVALLAMLLIPLLGGRGERSPAVRPLAVAGVAAVVITLALLTWAGSRAPWEPRFDTQPLTMEQIGVQDLRAEAGALVFLEKGCQYCHGMKDEGGQQGGDLTYAARDLPKALILSRILNGTTGMPSYAGNMTPEELEDLMHFLRVVAGVEGEP